MVNNTVTFSLNIVDNATKKVQSVTASTKDLHNAVRSVTEEVRSCQRTIVDWSQAAEMLNQSISQLYQWSKDVTQAYQIQLVAETQLVTVMKQRMKATDKEVQSIKYPAGLLHPAALEQEEAHSRAADAIRLGPKANRQRPPCHRAEHAPAVRRAGQAVRRLTATTIVCNSPIEKAD